jgi:hypothetical protein
MRISFTISPLFTDLHTASAHVTAKKRPSELLA